jgi:hypothetical protein
MRMFSHARKNPVSKRNPGKCLLHLLDQGLVLVVGLLLGPVQRIA